MRRNGERIMTFLLLAYLLAFLVTSFVAIVVGLCLGDYLSTLIFTNDED
jgi:hypothetical protein